VRRCGRSKSVTAEAWQLADRLEQGKITGRSSTPRGISGGEVLAAARFVANRSHDLDGLSWCGMGRARGCSLRRCGAGFVKMVTRQGQVAGQSTTSTMV
jgi:hypothetical protein